MLNKVMKMFTMHEHGWTGTTSGETEENKWLTASTLAHAGGHKKVHSSC